MKTFSRRTFIENISISTAGFTILPSTVIAGLGHKPPSDKLNIAGIGIGGYGYKNLRNMETENIVALCDVDWDYSSVCFKRWHNAKQYKDYRELLEKEKEIDAVVIATPDHSHALPAILAMRQGKHVFLQSPLSHSIYESRLLNETSQKYNIATQMGNQGSSGEGVRQLCEWIWAGVIGEVTHVDTWTTHPDWQQPLWYPEKSKRAPRNLDWDLFIGPAAERPYNPIYHPWNWRCWFDFGNGAMGDMAPHIFDPVFKALKLHHPISVEASSSLFNAESFPNSEFVRYEFSKRDNLPKVAMPKVTVTWYDGGWMPARPQELKDGEPMGDKTGGCIFHGTEGKIMCGTYGQAPTLLPTEKMKNFTEPAKSIPRIFNAMEGGHEQDWIRACKESPDKRLETSSPFSYSGPLTETILLGIIAIKSQSLNKKLLWDGNNMKFKNIGFNDQLQILTKNKFKIDKGIPKNYNEFTTLQANHTLEEWIRPTYRKGWEQL